MTEKNSLVIDQSRNRRISIPVECVGVVGLGYVGLSLAAGLSNVARTIGFDINAERIKELQGGIDRNNEIPNETLACSNLQLTTDPETLADCDFLIITVPTPVDGDKHPNLAPLIGATNTVARVLKIKHFRDTDSKIDIGVPTVVFESTVFPGCIEEICIPALEKESGLVSGKDFTVGYSPERINPGDLEHKLQTVVKVVSARDAETLEVMAQVYGSLTKAGIYKAPDIRTAEAAKVIENIQRDLNIALMNELAIVFHRLGLNTQEVLETAQTKWNFLPFKPGFVGGECIPVDPYYLTTKAEEVGYQPEVILAGRKINDGMGPYVGQETVDCLNRAGKSASDARVLVLGLAFKENVRDTRNSGVIDMIRELERQGCTVFVDDPIVGHETVADLGFTAVRDSFSIGSCYDAVVLAVSHDPFLARPIGDYQAIIENNDGQGVLIDVKGVLNKSAPDLRDVLYWTL